MTFQELSHRHCILAMPFHSQMQRFQPLQELKRIERTHRRSQIAKQLDARFENVSDIHATEGLVEFQTVVTGIRFGHTGEFSIIPGESPFFDDDSADGSSMATNEFGTGCHHDIRTMLKRTQ